MKALARFVAVLIKFTLVALLVLVALATLLAWLGLRIDLGMLRAPMEVAAGEALGREVNFSGPMVLVPSLRPSIEVSDVSIANAPGFGDQRFATLGLLRMQLSLAPLLSGEIHVNEVTAEKVRLNLQSSVSGEPNWFFGRTQPTGVEQKGAEDAVTGVPFEVLFVAVDDLSLVDIEASYTDLAIGQSVAFKVKKLKGAMPKGESLDLVVQGALNDQPFDLQLTAGNLPQSRTGKAAWPLSVKGEIAGTSIDAKGGLIKGESPEITAELTLGAVDVGSLLQRLGVIDGLSFRVGGVTADVHLRGDSLSEIVADSKLALQITTGRWLLRDANSGAEFDVAITLGEMTLGPGDPLSFTLDSKIDSVPLKIGITGAVAEDYLKKGRPLPLRLNVVGGGAELVLETRVTRPIDPNNLAFKMSLKGNSMDTLNVLLHRELPPLGPYRLGGTFASVPRGYEVRDLDLRIAETRLRGRFSLDTRKNPPYLQADLRSERLQLNDFKLGDWSPAPDGAARKAATSASGASGTTNPDSEHAVLYSLLDAQSLREQDIEAALAVDAVLSGKDNLGHGSLRLLLDKGRLQFDPIELAAPGGEAKIRFMYFPTGAKSAEFALDADVEQFDYGILARRIDPASKVDGRLSLDVDITASGGSIDDLLANGDGHLDFGVWPGHLKADIFELWAVNVISSLAHKMDKDAQSRVNCVIARFKLEKGVMNDHVIYADTTHMRIEGTAQIDFNRQRLSVRARPKAKRPEFFSLATPVSLSGGFEDYDVRVNPIELGGSAVSFVTSPLHVPLRRLFKQGGEPPEGEQACKQAWNLSDGLTDSRGAVAAPQK